MKDRVYTDSRFNYLSSFGSLAAAVSEGYGLSSPQLSQAGKMIIITSLNFKNNFNILEGFQHTLDVRTNNSRGPRQAIMNMLF